MSERVLITVAGFRRALFASVAAVSLAGLVAEVVRVTGYDPAYDEFCALLSLSFESNLPTWFASSLLVTASVLLTILALLSRRTQPGQPSRVVHWALLATAFAYISLDETVGLHERANEWIDGTGPLYFSWIVPGAIAVALVGALMWPLLASLHRTTRTRFIVAGALYVTGALFFEIPLGIWTEENGDENLMYSLIDWGEETLELVGVSWFLVALVAQIGTGPGRPPGDAVVLATAPEA